MTRNSLLVSLLQLRLDQTKLGLLIKGIDKINPYKVMKELSSLYPDRHYYVSIVGYEQECAEESDQYDLATNIEKAVWWRSRPEYASAIIVFIKGDTDKLHSLADFDIISSKELVSHLIEKKINSAANAAEKGFWLGLTVMSNTISINMLEEFVLNVESLEESDFASNGIANSLWCLNLLCDNKILDNANKSDNVSSRLMKNRDLIVQMSYLSDTFRKKISSALARTADIDEKQRLRQVYSKLQDYFKFGSKDTLKQLQLDDVTDLFSVSKKKPQKTVVDIDPDDLDVVTKEKELRGIELDREISDALIDSNDESLSSWKDLLDEIKSNVEDDPNNFNTNLVHEDRPVLFKTANSKLRQIIGRVCNSDVWGAIVTTEEAVLRTAIYNENNEYEYFRPNHLDNSSVSYNDASLFELMSRYDSSLKEKGLGDSEDPSFDDLVDRLKVYREKLVANMDLILSCPVLFFGLDDEGRESLIKYVDTWTSLYQLFDKRHDIMKSIGDSTTSHIAQSLLRLDILYVKTPTEYKAILLPLHPVYLWRYYEVAKLLSTNKDSISDEEKESLKQVVNSLPQVLNFVVVDKNITDGKAAVLPCSGNIEFLPTYENKTNRYLGTNGIDCVQDFINRWVSYAPYTKSEVRICTIDAPDHLSILHMLADILDEQIADRIVYNIYLTKGQNGNRELSLLDFSSGEDAVVGEHIKDNRIILSVKNVDNKSADVLAELKQRPVHIAFYFDQSEYSIDYGQRQSLYINPLVVTYSYDYDEIGHHGRLYPSMESDSGLVGGYHKMLNLSGLTAPHHEPHVNSYSSTDTGNIVASLEDGFVQWLVVADRSTSNYNPSNAIPIGERSYDKRIVNIWAQKDTRIVKDYEKLLRKYNITPKNDILVDVLSKYGHISSSGLISIPKSGADSSAIEKRKKGLIGTLFAASWYSQRSKDSVVVSLDTQNARCWLFSSEGEANDERADLLGLYFDEDTQTLHINPLEVKTHDGPVEVTCYKNGNENCISGHAADQVARVVSILNEIFGISDPSSLEMFISARREVLKYQIVSECFRNVHDPKWQKRWEGILKDAFRSPDERKYSLEIGGILLHVKLNVANSADSNVYTYEGSYDTCSIEFVQLAAKDIQKIVFEQSETEINLPSYPETARPDSNTKVEAAVEKSTVDIPERTIETIDMTPPLETPTITQPVVKEPTLGDASDENIPLLVKSFKRACSSFHVKVAECDPSTAVIGPSLVRLRFRLEQGQTLNAIKRSLEDIGREMQRTNILIREIPNSNELNLDIPKLHRDKVLFADVVKDMKPTSSVEQLFFPLGRTPEGKDIILNLAEMPHLLVGGSTGSGKTVFLFSMLASILMSHKKAEDLTLVLSTSKMEDFVYFEAIPHLYSGKVISDALEATDLIKGFVAEESRRRGEILAASRVSNIIEYNKKNTESPMAPIVVVIDEFADLSDQLSSKKEKDEFYQQVQRIAQTGRSRGIHLVVCTQRPEAKLVPPTTKAQLNGRVALRVNDGISSKMIIDCTDAQNLQKHGDLIYKNGDVFERAQGYFISTTELEDILNNLS